MGVLSAFSLDIVLAAVTAIWFIVDGVVKQRRAPSAGRRSLPTATWVVVVRRIRGILQLLGGLALIALAVLNYLKFNVPPIGLGLGLGLAVLALWTAVESWVPPLRPVRIILAVIGFALAVFYAGFRG
jgi:hypothetical protein